MRKKPELRLGSLNPRSKEQGARSKEQGARSKEQGARSKEQGARLDLSFSIIHISLPTR